MSETMRETETPDDVVEAVLRLLNEILRSQNRDARSRFEVTAYWRARFGNALARERNQREVLGRAPSEEA